MYPADRLTARTIENLPGEMYDPAKTKQLFVEDIIQCTDHIRAIEDEIEDVVKPSIGEGGGGGMENPLTVDLDFDGYKAIALACDNGATLPATAVIGQWFLHTPTGRKILFQYNGTSWTPICSLGAMTIYVSTTGTDDQEHGTGTGTDAFATIAYAYTQIPGTLNGNVAINLGAGSYSGVSTLRGKVFTDNYNISINGDYSVGADQTISARTNATSAVYGLVTVSGAGWTTNEHKGKIIVFTKLGGVTPGTLTYRVVKSNTSDTLTLLGIAVTGLAVNDTFGFVTHNSIFLGAQSYYQENVIPNFVKYDVGTAYGAFLGSNVTMNGCRIESTYNIFLDTVFKMAVLNHCSLQMEGASGTHAIETQSTSAIRLSGTFIYHSGSTTNNAGVHVTAGTFLVIRDNTLIQGGATTKFMAGILIEGGGIVDHRIGSFIEDCVAGVKCNNNGTDFSSLGPGTAFANNTQNYVAVPGLYSSTGTPRGAHIVEGSATLVNGTVQVTMSGAAAAFSSTTSYTVLVSSTLNDRTLKVVNDSVTQFTITSSDLTDTDVVRYVVIGS